MGPVLRLKMYVDREKRVPKPGSSIRRVSTAGASAVELVDRSWL